MKQNLFLCILIFFVNSSIHLYSSDIQSRRSYLNWHQALGMATWVSWLATNIAGEDEYRKDYKFYKLRDTLPDQIFASYILEPKNEKLLLYFGMKNFEEHEKSTHGQLGYLTFGLYSASAALAFLAPEKYDITPQEGWSTIWTHRATIFIHLPAMLALPYIGKNLNHASDVDTMRSLGWLGFSALTVSIATFYF